MTRFNKILAWLFAVQLLLALGIFLGSQPPSIESVRTALLSVEKSQINRMTIESGDGKQVQLDKVDDRWQLPNYYQLPADQNKIERALSRLSDTKSGWPVATTSSSQERFEVSEDKYQTRITLSEGDDERQQLYLGTSPGFRQIHLRRAGEEDIYAVKLNSYDFPTEASDWLDRALVRPEGDISALDGPGFHITKQDDKWQLADANGALVKDELDGLLKSLNALSVLGAEEKTVGENVYRLNVKMAKNSIQYQFFTDGDEYYVSHGKYSPAFKISKMDYEKITGQTADKLVKVEDQKKSEHLTSDSAGALQQTDNS